jgi:hypothetical protein
MSGDTIRLIATYVIALLVLVGAFVLIYTAKGDAGQAWLAVGAVLGYVFRDSAGREATLNAVRTANAVNGTPNS